MSNRRYSVILGNLGNTCDRFCGSYKSNPPALDMLKAAAKIPHVKGIELVGTWDIRPDNVAEMKQALTGHGLTCASIIPYLFSRKEFTKVAYSNPTPALRRQAIDESKQMCDIALDLGCDRLRKGGSQTLRQTCLSLLRIPQAAPMSQSWMVALERPAESAKGAPFSKRVAPTSSHQTVMASSRA